MANTIVRLLLGHLMCFSMPIVFLGIGISIQLNEDLPEYNLPCITDMFEDEPCNLVHESYCGFGNW